MVLLSPSDIQYQRAHASEDKSKGVVVGCVICTVVSYIAVLLRFVSRRLSKTAIKSDDAMMILTLVGSLVIR